MVWDFHLFALCVWHNISFENVTLLFLAAEMLDPKAKESPPSKSPFPWSRRENSTSSSNGTPRIITKPPPVPSHSVHTVQSYAKAQEEQNATALSKTEHRYWY